MEKIAKGLYRIDKNNELINEALLLLNNGLPKSYAEKYNAYYETSKLLNSIIDDRSKKTIVL